MNLGATERSQIITNCSSLCLKQNFLGRWEVRENSKSKMFGVHVDGSYWILQRPGLFWCRKGLIRVFFFLISFRISNVSLLVTNKNIINALKIWRENRINNNENIQSRYRNGIRHQKMRHASNEKWGTTHDRKNRTTKSRKNQNARRKGNLQIFGNIESWHPQTNGDKETNLKKNIYGGGSYLRQNYIAGTLSGLSPL